MASGQIPQMVGPVLRLLKPDGEGRQQGCYGLAGLRLAKPEIAGEIADRLSVLGFAQDIDDIQHGGLAGG